MLWIICSWVSLGKDEKGVHCSETEGAICRSLNLCACLNPIRPWPKLFSLCALTRVVARSLDAMVLILRIY